MDNPLLIYEVFNYGECAAWIVVAMAIPFRVRGETFRQRFGIAAAAGGFVLFGISDFLEAPTHGQLPLWLWGYKIGCAAFILSCRYFYLGWNRFRLTDRYFLFGVGCLGASLGAIWLQAWLYGAG